LTAGKSAIATMPIAVDTYEHCRWEVLGYGFLNPTGGPAWVGFISH
jgi:hypothetical protein